MAFQLSAAQTVGVGVGGDVAVGVISLGDISGDLARRKGTGDAKLHLITEQGWDAGSEAGWGEGFGWGGGVGGKVRGGGREGEGWGICGDLVLKERFDAGLGGDCGGEEDGKDQASGQVDKAEGELISQAKS